MKSKQVFSVEQVEEIRKLLREKMNKSDSEQKLIRDKIRALGFYIRDYHKSSRPFTVEDFDQLIKDGKIKITKPCLIKKLFNIIKCI